MKSAFLKLIPLFVIVLLSIGIAFFIHALFEPVSILILRPWIYIDDSLPWLMVLTLAYCLHKWLSKEIEAKNAFRELIPLLVVVFLDFGLGFFIQTMFSPISILKPWIYFADVAPWLMVVTLGYCLYLRLPKWNGFWRSVFIAVIGIWVGVPLDSVFGDVNDEIGARRMALAGEDDPYHLYGDESGMRNNGTQQLGKDTWDAFVDGIEESVIFLPIILFVAALVYYRATIRKLFGKLFPARAG